MSALTYSRKKYLFAIYKLGKNGETVKSADVARALGVTKASAAAMAAKLCECGYIRKEHYGQIELTEAGVKAANVIYTNSLIIKDFLEKNIGIPSENADADAAGIVSNISEGSADLFVEYILKKRG